MSQIIKKYDYIDIDEFIKSCKQAGYDNKSENKYERISMNIIVFDTILKEKTSMFNISKVLVIDNNIKENDKIYILED